MTDDITVRLRQRMRRGLFASIHNMEEAAGEIDSLRTIIVDLQQDLVTEQKRYDFVLQQWMAERFISDQLYADLVTRCNDDKTEYMIKYEQSRRHGTVASSDSPE